MKKSMTLGILFLSVIFLASCGKSQKDKLVGEGEIDGTTSCTFKSNGEVLPPDGVPGKGTWKVTKEDKDSLEMEIYEDGELQATADVQFTSDNEMKLRDLGDGQVMVLTRKK